MKKFYVETYGCQMNFYDSQVVDGVLEERGMVKVDRPEDSDVILINTCSVRDKAEQRVRGRVNQLAGLRYDREEGPLIGLLGCMAQRLGGTLLEGKKSPLDFVVGTDQYMKLPEIIARAHGKEADLYFTDFDHVVTYEAQPKSMPPGGSHYVAVMHGCDKFCTYCIVPFTRGRERSKPVDVILREVETIADQDGFEVTLLGQTISSYKHEDVDFAGLLEQVSQVRGIESLRFMTSYPTDLTAELFAAMEKLPKVERRIHLPVQSGSDRILKIMNRRYTLAEYEKILDLGRREMPGLIFSTDIIVGFPGETEEDFQATLDLVKRQRFVSAYMFKYSPREGTLSARNEDDVPTEVKEERLSRLMEVQSDNTQNYLQERMGSEMEILLDETSKKTKNQLRGRTRDQFRVVVDRSPQMRIGSRIRVRIVEIRGETLMGIPLS
ncbi:tRNA (N6-isopentenyl adenosine(37)-C2)-methylthiotransferase MiaB [bacterium]|nr:tRNA (N6-isopentenyl adenosine(37)-C2)-methylthiotransferase MiaB [bacterium]